MSKEQQDSPQPGPYTVTVSFRFKITDLEVMGDGDELVDLEIGERLRKKLPMSLGCHGWEVIVKDRTTISFQWRLIGDGSSCDPAP